MAVFRPAMRIKEKPIEVSGEVIGHEFALEVRNDVWAASERIGLPSGEQLQKVGDDVDRVFVFEYVKPFPWRRLREDAEHDAQTFIREQFNRQRGDLEGPPIADREPGPVGADQHAASNAPAPAA